MEVSSHQLQFDVMSSLSVSEFCDWLTVFSMKTRYPLSSELGPLFVVAGAFSDDMFTGLWVLSTLAVSALVWEELLARLSGARVSDATLD